MLNGQNFGPVRQNDSYRIAFSLEDADGDPFLLVDLSSASIVWRWSSAKAGPALGEVVATLIDAGNGEAAAQIIVPTAIVGAFHHELEMTLSGDITTMATGMFWIEADLDLV